MTEAKKAAAKKVAAPKAAPKPTKAKAEASAPVHPEDTTSATVDSLDVQNTSKGKLIMPNGVNLSPGQSCTLEGADATHPAIKGWLEEKRLTKAK